MAPPKIKLYLDVVSPFGYIAFHILQVRRNGTMRMISTTAFHPC